MACCPLRNSVQFSGLNEKAVCSDSKGIVGFCRNSVSSLTIESKSKLFPVLSMHSLGKPMAFAEQIRPKVWSTKSASNYSTHGQSSICVSKAIRWWEKPLKPNMVEIHSAQQLVDSLINAGDRLVVVDFYSPGCGGCKSLHPKICQLAESNPNAMFLKVNFEKLKTMCCALHIHVLPFFRFYRGSEGRLCSFSCTVATIKKFKDALAKHGTDRCSLGPAKGLDESELIAFASAGELPMNSPLPSTREEIMDDLFLQSVDIFGVLSRATGNLEMKEDTALL